MVVLSLLQIGFADAVILTDVSDGSGFTVMVP